MMKNGNELESSEGRGGGKGSGIREADSDDRWFPPKTRLVRKTTAHGIKETVLEIGDQID